MREKQKNTTFSHILTISEKTKKSDFYVRFLIEVNSTEKR